VTNLDLVLAKGVLESVFQRFGLMIEYQPNCGFALASRTYGSLWLQGNRLGTLGNYPSCGNKQAYPMSIRFPTGFRCALGLPDQQDEMLTTQFHLIPPTQLLTDIAFSPRIRSL